MDVLTSCSSFQCSRFTTRGRHSLHIEGKAFWYVFPNKYFFNSRYYIILIIFWDEKDIFFTVVVFHCCVSIRTLRLKIMSSAESNSSFSSVLQTFQVHHKSTDAQPKARTSSSFNRYLEQSRNNVTSTVQSYSLLCSVQVRLCQYALEIKKSAVKDRCYRS